MPESTIPEILDGGLRLIQADVSNALDLVDDGSVQLALTSPPYNLRKIYERDRAMSLEEYVDWLTPVVDKICKKITTSGSVCWQVGNFLRDGEVFPLDYYFYNMFASRNFKLRNRIIWKFNFGLHATKRLSGRYETLLWFTKSDEYLFNLDPIRVPQLYPGKRHAARKGEAKAGKPSGNPLGKNPSDFWTFSADDCFSENPIWEIPNVKANHPEYTSHPCQFPHELAERCVLAFSKVGDVVLDPFVGAGTTAIAAIKADRVAIGIDRSKEYVDLTHQRVKALRAGTLELRRSGIEVRKPLADEKVSQVPGEWSEAAE
ncbi:site-specific DNA-methyltransferase [Mesorhizobium sp. B2-9-1]|uniref:DNA-methyltransferase n=1 Tax=Mesorhizobium sp. B2-9-1 TaxID=2589898 RepID=UPI0011264C4D|nr:site-specific DNA-methyltransferase [Mesorhizobium sp. B2-9-1]TPI45475.1 site-specific DNA-methyltransferase [Mesorhizobium sp. B2-9-1]